MPIRKLSRKTYQRSLPALILKIIVGGFIFSLLFFLAAFIFLAKDLPRPERFTEKQFIQSTKIYDKTGEILLYEIYGEEKRTIVSLDKIPDHLKNAVIVVEDANFYKHFGVDIKGILRSIMINLEIKSPTYGGSTLNQQLIRSTFFSPEKTLKRKFRELILALELDRRYSKDQILEWYLNQVPFGSNSYGVEAASQTYFRKSVSEISLEESAILAALIQGPSRLSPYGENRDDLLRRKDYVLNRMAQEGILTEEETEEAKKKEIIFNESPTQIKAPYFTLWVKQQLEEKYGEDFLRNNGLKVYTSLDWDLQQIAEKAAKEAIEKNKSSNARNQGLVSIDPRTGEVLAMVVGNGDYYAKAYPEGCISGVSCMFDPKFNVVIGTKKNPGRQPGSAFKPFVYATAFENGASDQEIIIDEETNFGVWGDEEYIPKNYDDRFRGEVSLRQALAQSLNVPSVKVLLDFAGIDASVKTAQGLGISTLSPPYGPSIVLGGWEVKLIEMVSAYGAFATNGLRIQPVSILKIEDNKGNVIEINQKSPKRVLSKEAAVLINDVLSDNDARAPMFGYNSYLYFDGYQVAAKTGTTQDYRDAWAIGYTPSIVTGVWVGNNNNEPMLKSPAVVLAGYGFHRFMEEAILRFPKEDFEKPKVTEAEINLP
ncbi:MAG: PBP1A family penicillin-binding protein [Candidatus Nealsonbacteria bacterium]